MKLNLSLISKFKLLILNQLILKTLSQIIYAQPSPTNLEDDLQFVLNWPGNLIPEEDLKDNLEVLNIRTIHNEKYKCTLPILNDHNILNNNLNRNDQISEETPIQTSSLLSTLYTKKLCSYRIESYWIYELCHGQFVKQYHETKSAGKRLITEEYYLGYFDQTKQEPDYFKQNDDNKLIPNIHYRTLNGEKVPMYAVKYTDGTMCEILKDTPREITIFYACDEFGNDNIVTFEEISSCMYEMIVITKWICSHPAYKTPEKVYPEINCYSIDNSPHKPDELTNLEYEQSVLVKEQNKVKMTDKSGDTFIIHYKTIDDEPSETNDNDNQLNEEQQESSQNQFTSTQSNKQQQEYPTQPSISDQAQKEMIKSFLNGAHCLNGGSGWWKYEICYGKHVTQYHEDEKTKKRTNILLGSWNKQNHIEWMKNNPNKRPVPNKSERIFSSMLYSDGSKCDETNKNRFVEVKFKCLKNKSPSAAVALYLIEPALCEYLLAIESNWLCDFIESVDSDGIPGELKLNTDNANFQNSP